MKFTFKKLLNIDSNPKTVKGQAHGFMTAVLYLAPYKASGFNVCPMAEQAGCYAGCLNTAGHGGISKGGKRMRTAAGMLPANQIQRARIARTRLFINDRPEFFRRLYQEINAFLRKAERAGLTPVIRLNGTSDIIWEKIPMPVSDNTRGIHCYFANVFAVWPEVQFYDYTKIYKRFEREQPSNYHLSLSYSLASRKYAQACTRAHDELGASLVVVTRDAEVRDFHIELGGIDGDAHDLRFLDPAGSMVYLKAKGSARKDRSGFVID
jgi:hypothetical protein